MRERPKSKIIGTITTDIYEGNILHSGFKGDIPPATIMALKITLSQDYYLFMSKRAQENNDALAEKVRVRKAKEAEDERKLLAISQLKEADTLKLRQKIDTARAELKEVKHTNLNEMTELERRRADKRLLDAEAMLQDALAEQDKINEEKED